MPLTREQLTIAHAYPDVEIVPLSNHRSIKDFINRFKKLQSLEFQVIKPNQEVQADVVFEGIQELRRRIDAKNTVLTHTNSEGLNQDDAVRQIEGAAAAGNEKIFLRGKDSAGNKLAGTSETIKLELAMDVPDTDKQRAEALAAKYEELASNGILHQDKPAQDHVPLLRRLFFCPPLAHRPGKRACLPKRILLRSSLRVPVFGPTAPTSHLSF